MYLQLKSQSRAEWATDADDADVSAADAADEQTNI